MPFKSWCGDLGFNWSLCQRDDLICHLKWKLRNSTLCSKIIIKKKPCLILMVFGLYRTGMSHLSVQAVVLPLELACHSLLFLDPEAKPESPAESFTGNLTQHSAEKRSSGWPDSVMKQYRHLSVGALTQQLKEMFLCEWGRTTGFTYRDSHMPTKPQLSPRWYVCKVLQVTKSSHSS